MNIKKDLTTVNFTKKNSRNIQGLVIHSMWGTYAGSIAWFKNPKAQASAHYNISEHGEITQTVEDKDIAWHAGVFDEPIPDYLSPNPNNVTLGIELEDKRDSNWAYPEAQRQATRELVSMLMKKYNIPQDHVHLHKELNPSRRSDPVGAFSRDWLFSNEKMVTLPQREVNELRKARDDNHNAHMKCEADSNKAKEEYEKTIKNLNEQIEGKNEELRKVLQDKDKLAKEHSECYKAVELLQAQNSQLNETVIELSDQNKMLADKIQPLRDENETLRRSNSQLKRRIDELTNKISLSEAIGIIVKRIFNK